MNRNYRPEGAYIHTAENREYLSSLSALERAMRSGAIVEGLATLCDESMRLHVDLHCAEGILSPEEAVFCRAGEERKDIAIITRVGKPVACRILGMEFTGECPVIRLSRRAVQKECVERYLAELRPGDIIPARVTHMEPFGAFLDIGCGISSLLSVDCISVSRISHPRDRLFEGMQLPVVVKNIQREYGRIYVSLRELLGTWEENAAEFEAGRTVTGIIRSVESYGVFVELAPNLAGLAEVKESTAEELRKRIGQSVAVYIKSIAKERMKIKLVLVDSFCSEQAPRKLRFFVDQTKVSHISRWRYSPENAKKTVETVFEEEK